MREQPRPPSSGASVLSVISVCLLALGGALLIQQVWPDFEWLVGAAVGLLRASALAVALYVGTFITLLYIPTLALLAFALLVIGGRQSMAGHGLGWQLWLGGAFLALFGFTVADPAQARAIVPIVLIAMGAALAAAASPAPETERTADGGY